MLGLLCAKKEGCRCSGIPRIPNRADYWMGTPPDFGRRVAVRQEEDRARGGRREGAHARLSGSDRQGRRIVAAAAHRAVAVVHNVRARGAVRELNRVAALDRGVQGEVGRDEALAAAATRRQGHERDRVAAAGRRRRVGHFSAVDGAQRTNRRRLVAGHAGAEQSGHRDGRDDADDRHDDQQLDERETLLVTNLHCHLSSVA